MAKKLIIHNSIKEYNDFETACNKEHNYPDSISKRYTTPVLSENVTEKAVVCWVFDDFNPTQKHPGITREDAKARGFFNDRGPEE